MLLEEKQVEPGISTPTTILHSFKIAMLVTSKGHMMYTCRGMIRWSKAASDGTLGDQVRAKRTQMAKAGARHRVGGTVLILGRRRAVTWSRIGNARV